METSEKHLDELLKQLDKANSDLALMVEHLEEVVLYNDDVNEILEEQVKSEIARKDQPFFIKEMFK